VDTEHRQAVVQEEDLDEDRGVADDLDVGDRQLVEHRDSVGAHGFEDEPDHVCEDDPQQPGLDRVLEAVPERAAEVPEEGPLERREDVHGPIKHEWPPRRTAIRVRLA